MVLDILAYMIILAVVAIYLFYVFVREGREPESGPPDEGGEHALR
jgi:hypothetical protein